MDPWTEPYQPALPSVAVGVILVVAGAGFLVWSERRAIEDESLRREGPNAALVGLGAVDPANDGRLVFTVGRAAGAELVADPVFGVPVEGLRLFRDVEMLQWRELRQGDAARYETVWLERPIASQGFAQAAEHVNPPFPFASESWSADVRLGAFRVDASLVAQLAETVGLAVGEPELAAVPEPLRGRLHAHGGTFFQGADPDQPAVGDLRVRFRTVRDGTVSVLARQDGDRLAPYTTRGGATIGVMRAGDRQPQLLLADARRPSSRLGRLGRLMAGLTLLVGFSTLLRPLARRPSPAVPSQRWLAPLVGLGLRTAAVWCALTVGCAAAAVPWLVYRPPVGLVLLGLAVASGYGIYRVLRRGVDSRTEVSS